MTTRKLSNLVLAFGVLAVLSCGSGNGASDGVADFAGPDPHDLARGEDGPEEGSSDAPDTLVMDVDKDAGGHGDLDMSECLDIPPDLTEDQAIADQVEAADESGPAETDVADLPVVPAPLYDMALIRDAGAAACKFSDQHTAVKGGMTLDVWKVSYYSLESVNGELHPILIRGFAARPAAFSGKMPGVVLAHGLGGFAQEKDAVGLVQNLGQVFVIAYTGPGGGNSPDNTSEGIPAMDGNGYRMFDTLKDMRGSWFWGHAVAAMRALTCLEGRAEVDPTRLGITGFSAGGVVSHIVAGVDDRVVAAVPISGVLAWDVAVKAPKAWQHALLAQAGLTTDSLEWVKLMDLVNPALVLAGTKAKIFDVNGTCDEFFPLTAHMATYSAIPADGRSMSLVANFDHGCFKMTGGESADTIEDRAAVRISGGQRAWFRHWFGLGGDYAYFPASPVVQVTPMGSLAVVTAVVDGGGANLAIEDVKVWVSNDQAYLFGGISLTNAGGTIYNGIAPIDANSVYFVDVQYKTNSLLPERFSVSSTPGMPDGMVPNIRDIATCL